MCACLQNKGNYAFGYAINEGASSFHEESGSPGMKLGAYGVTEADGTQRVVNYIADENGFRASVEVKDQDPHQVTPGHHTVLVAQVKSICRLYIIRASSKVNPYYKKKINKRVF